jgi:hypothetical protein
MSIRNSAHDDALTNDASWRFDLHHVIGILRAVVHDEGDMIALGQQTVLTGGDGCGKHCVREIVRKRKRHQRTVWLPLSLCAENAKGLFGQETLDSFCESWIGSGGRRLQRAVPREERFVFYGHLKASNGLGGRVLGFVPQIEPVAEPSTV